MGSLYPCCYYEDEWVKWPFAGDATSILRSQEESFELYQDMYAEQQLILRNGEDYKALRRGLRAFSNLRRIHVHEHLWNVSLVESPLRRLLPHGLFWPGRIERPEALLAYNSHFSYFTPWNPDDPDLWYGVNAVVGELGQYPESKIDDLCTSMGNEQFKGSYPNYQNMVQIFSQLRNLDLRLDLDESSFMAQQDQIHLFRNDLFCEALEGACKLEHLKLEVSEVSRHFRDFSGFCFSLAIPLEVSDTPLWPCLR